MKDAKKIIFVTGQSGIEKDKIVESIYTRIPEAEKPFHVGKRLCRELRAKKGRVLQKDSEKIDLGRKGIMNQIKQEILRSRKRIFLVNTHMCFRWRGKGFFFAFDFDQIREFGISGFMTIIDDVDLVKKRLEARHFQDRNYPVFSVKDIVIWREEEFIVTEAISKFFKIDHFIVPRKNALEIIIDLICKPKKKKCYASFPMSYAKPSEDKEIKAFIDKMKQRLVIFDPSALQEKIKLTRKFLPRAQKKRLKSISIGKVDSRQVRVPVYDLQAIESDIDTQIQIQDFKFIQQSDIVVAYVPTRRERPLRSDGSTIETWQAYEQGKEVHLIWTASGHPSSPWLKYNYKHTSPNAFLDWLEKHDCTVQ